MGWGVEIELGSGDGVGRRDRVWLRDGMGRRDRVRLRRWGGA